MQTEKEFQANVSAFEAMLNNGAKEHVRSACKTYNFDFFNDQSSNVSEELPNSNEPFSPFTWKDEENNVEYFKPAVKLELKPRMRVSALLGQKEEVVKADGNKGRLSLPGGLSRVSIFS